MKIDIMPYYRVRDGSGKYAKYRTYKSALGKLAWYMIFDKYGEYYEPDTGYIGIKNAVPSWVTDIGCGCYHGDSYSCDIHDRETGYLRKLHTRLVRYLLLKYPAPELAEFPK